MITSQHARLSLGPCQPFTSKRPDAVCLTAGHLKPLFPSWPLSTSSVLGLRDADSHGSRPSWRLPRRSTVSPEPRSGREGGLSDGGTRAGGEGRLDHRAMGGDAWAEPVGQWGKKGRGRRAEKRLRPGREEPLRGNPGEREPQARRSGGKCCRKPRRPETWVSLQTHPQPFPRRVCGLLAGGTAQPPPAPPASFCLP